MKPPVHDWRARQGGWAATQARAAASAREAATSTSGGRGPPWVRPARSTPRPVVSRRTEPSARVKPRSAVGTPLVAAPKWRVPGRRTRPPARLPENERPAATVAGGVGALTPPLARWDPADDLGADYVTRAWQGLGEEACGWVVDLRGPGGDVFTLLMALAPLLGPGRAIGFAGPKGTTTWSLPGTAR